MWGGGVRAGTYVDEHGSAELFNQILDLCGIERGLLLSLGQYDMAHFALLKPAYIFQVDFKVVHCLCKCGVLFHGRAGKFRLQCRD